jgi:hypothetical protein
VTGGRQVLRGNILFCTGSDNFSTGKGQRLTLPVFRKVLGIIMSGAQATAVDLQRITATYVNLYLLRFKRVVRLLLCLAAG